MDDRLYLQIVTGSRAGELVEIPRNQTVLIGRLSESFIQFSEDPTVSRRHFEIEFDPPICRLTHLSERSQTRVNNQPISSAELRSGDEITFGAQSCMRVVNKTLGNAQQDHSLTDSEMPNAPDFESALECSKESPQLPSQRTARIAIPTGSDTFLSSIRSSNADVMFARLGQLVGVLQMAASTATFAEEIAQAAMEMVNLDRAAVLEKDGQIWKTVAVARQLGTREVESWQPSRSILNQLATDKRTMWGRPSKPGASTSESMLELIGVVAAPILDAHGEVIGAVYGDRRITIDRPIIDHFDAKMVEIMACGVAGGWARVEQEQAAVAERVQLERFVTKEVARKLQDDPDALLGRDAEVTMLFCDIAGFSRISEQMSPTDLFKWINMVMEELSNCVLATRGTLVDYVGDELIAMWGAPLDTPDHAALAAEAAIMMLESLKKLNSLHKLPNGETTQIGIGLDSGTVRVGNTGSVHKLKYGPLGSHVNIASRVQGATRYLRTPALITGATAELLKKSGFSTRRLCSVRLKNIENPVELFELVSDPGPTWNQLSSDYERALVAWEKLQLQPSISILSQLVSKADSDGPTMVLLARAVEAWSRGVTDYDPVWTLPSK